MGAGRFITFEGGEGAGKSTHARRLVEALRSAGLEAVLTREPGGSEGAEQIRELLVHGSVGRWDAVTEALLHFAARRDHLVKTIRPTLESGAWVVSDRFADSTIAYQGYGHGLGREACERLYTLTVGDFGPDLTFILDLPVEDGLRRADARGAGGTRYERMDRAFHERLRDGFLEIAKREPGRCVVIDATAQAGDVQGAIKAAVEDRLGITLA
jgi:dTMP kinase